MAHQPSGNYGTSNAELEGILARIRNGEEKAIDELIDAAYPLVRRLTGYILRGRFVAYPRGITSDISIISYQKFARKLRAGLERPFSNLGELIGYVSRTIVRTAIDEVARLGGPKEQVESLDAELPNAQGKDTDTRLRFYEMIEGLPPEEGAIIALEFLWGFSLPDIAKIIGLGVTTIKRKRLNALRRLGGEHDVPSPE